MPRFFCDQSFWNQPISSDARIDPRSDEYIRDMDAKFGSIHVNMYEYTIPVYYAKPDTPRRKVRQKPPRSGKTGDLLQRESRYRQHPKFAASLVPIPEGARPDGADDGHMAIVDWDSKTAWDMWRCRLAEDGQFESSTGMVYSLESDGVWKREDFPIQNGESMHFYGPSRAAGVPAIAGLILHDEIQAGKIEHKLAFASFSNKVQAHTYPATWTDGGWPDGMPEGCVMQLDPELDLDGFELSPGARTIARAMQRYGAVNVDGARGNVLYAEGVEDDPNRRWTGLLDKDDLRCIPLEHYRILKIENVVAEGDSFWHKRRMRGEK